MTIEVNAESPSELVITWSHDSEGPVQLELLRDGELIAEPAQDQSSYTDSDLDPNRRYEYRVVLRRGDEPIATGEAAAATLAHPPRAAGPFDAHVTGFSLVIVDGINPPETTYKVTVWNEEWYRNAKHYSEWSTSRCRTFEDLPTGLPFEFELVARNLDGVRTIPVRMTIHGKERLVLPSADAESGSGQDTASEAPKCQVLEALEPYDIESTPALLLLSGFSVAALEPILARPWVEDGLDETEREAMDYLGQVAAADEAAALRILDHPFLETVEPHDAQSLADLLEVPGLSAAAIESVLAKPWVEDGLDDTERKIIDHLGQLAADDEAAVLRILELPFLETVERHDAESLEDLLRVPVFSAAALESILARPWVEDGLDVYERRTVGRLRDIARRDEMAAARILKMPFLEAVGPDDVLMLDSLLGMADNGPALLGEVAKLDWISDGLDETETALVRDLGWIAIGDEAMALRIVGMPFLQAAEFAGEPEASAVNALWALGAHSQKALATVIERTWVWDGLDDFEAGMVWDLGWIAKRDEDAALRIMDMPFLQATELAGEPEALAVNALWSLGWNSQDALTQLIEFPWVEDGLNEYEEAVARNLGWIAGNEEAQALRILAMPFLETVEPADGAAMESLGGLALHRQEAFQRVMSHPTLSGGISGDWPKIVAVLNGVSQTDPDLIDVLLDPDQVTIEERMTDLPLAGEIQMAIIRIQPGAERSMDLLEYAVRYAEEFMSVPFPTGYVAWLFVDKSSLPSAAGSNYGTHIASWTVYDADEGSSHYADFTGGHIAHEVAHYYWRGNRAWINEGIANLMTYASENARIGSPVTVNARPCGYARTIAELESLDPPLGEPAFSCNYELGERIFVDLYRNLGSDKFRSGLRALHLGWEAAKRDEERHGAGMDIEFIKTVFKDFEDAGGFPVEAIADRWYDGTEPYDTSVRDTDPANPHLVTIDGRIHTAYLSTEIDGPTVMRISAEDVDDWLWLVIRWTYSVGSNTEVALEIVHYYEDGFEFGRRTASFVADTKYNNGLWKWWLHVGSDPSARWATGNYRVYVYNEGRKLVELEYEVTP